MKKIILIIVFAIIIIAGYWGIKKLLNPVWLKKSCPDEKIINKMPGSPESSYYIKNGKRMEIFEYSNSWVEANCQVPVQEVY